MDFSLPLTYLMKGNSSVPGKCMHIPENWGKTWKQTQTPEIHDKGLLSSCDITVDCCGYKQDDDCYRIRFQNQLFHLSVLRKLRVPGATPQQAVSLPPMHPVLSVPSLRPVHARDAMRLDETKARVTSIFGDILKLDSPKKVSFVVHSSMFFHSVMLVWRVTMSLLDTCI